MFWTLRRILVLDSYIVIGHIYIYIYIYFFFFFSHGFVFVNIFIFDLSKILANVK